MKKTKLVLIEWLDSHAGQGWRSMDDIKDSSETLHCRSVGWLKSETKYCKTVVPHIAGEKQGLMLQGCGDLTIPNKAIIKMTVLKT